MNYNCLLYFKHVRESRDREIFPDLPCLRIQATIPEIWCCDQPPCMQEGLRDRRIATNTVRCTVVRPGMACITIAIAC
jgi:hypothetical protein